MASSTSSKATVAVPLPEPFASIPRTELTFGPSPVHALPRISKALGGKVAIWAKREDCNSGIAFGGNKTRKLEYLIPEALSQNCDTLISIGGYQSNHTRAVAGASAHLGLHCSLIQEKWVNHNDPGNAKIGNIQLSRLMGASIQLNPSPFGIEHKDSLANLKAELIAQGRKPYYIPAGASDHPLGGLGFARWAFEVAGQEREMGVFWDSVVVCAVTGSTFAGMIAGFKLLEKISSSTQSQSMKRKRRIIGIDASAKPNESRAQVLRIAKFTAAQIGLAEDDITEEDVELDERYHAGTYGIPDEATVDAIKFGAEMEGFITDPVYEGKSLAGLMDLVRKGEIGEGSNVLYVHLGGQLALNAYSDI